ncbi:MAG: hypothetical protein FIB03_05365 [Anaerolineae bacterium]|nr:hypothetical protein [Anaerolineae bacterium]
MGPVTSRWNAAFAIMNGAGWASNVMPILKRIGRHLLGRLWWKDGSEKSVCDTVSFEIPGNYQPVHFEDTAGAISGWEFLQYFP